MNFKATILACLTFLTGIAIIITYSSQQDRYAIFSQDKAVFVFDRKNATLNYCTSNSCQLITPYIGAGESGGMLAGFPTQMGVVSGQPLMQPMMQQPGVMQMAQIAQPISSPIAPQSSLQTPPVPMGMQAQQVVLVPTPAPQPQAAAPAPEEAAPAADAPAEDAAPADDAGDDSADNNG